MRVGLRNRIQQRWSRIRTHMRTHARSGSAAIEFAMVAPVFFLFLFGIIETGVIFFANSALQNATDDVARLIRTGQISGHLTADDLRTRICAEVAGLISSGTCAANLQVDLRAYTNFAGNNYTTITKPDGSIDTTKLVVDNAGACEVVLMRSFYPWTIMTPMMAPLLQNMPGGQYLIASAAAFRTEPYLSGSSC